MIVLCFCFVCLRLVYPMLPVSLDCSFLIRCSPTFIVPHWLNGSTYHIRLILYQAHQPPTLNDESVSKLVF